jgi:hypothetical protein
MSIKKIFKLGKHISPQETQENYYDERGAFCDLLFANRFTKLFISDVFLKYPS